MPSDIAECIFCHEKFDTYCTKDICKDCCAKGYCSFKEKCMGYPVVVIHVKEKLNPSRR